MNRRTFFRSVAALALTAASGLPASAKPYPSPVISRTLIEQAEQVLREGAPESVIRSAVMEQFAFPDITNALEFVDVGADNWVPGDGKRLRIMGGDIDVAQSLIKTYGPNVIQHQRRMKLKSLSLYFADVIVNGNNEEDPREFDGIRRRAQIVRINAKKDLDFDSLDALIRDIPGANALLMSKRMRNIMTRRAPNAGRQAIWLRDRFGGRRATYSPKGSKAGLSILVTDYSDKNVQVIDFNEGMGGARGGDYTSIYVLRLGTDGLHARQNAMLEVSETQDISYVYDRDNARMVLVSHQRPVFQTLDVNRLRVEWLVTLETDTRAGPAIGRLTGIAKPSIA
uniref:Major capsid protein n=1 Tax=Caulobacter phage BL57 TaxID=3348355 RepID=A0AB74UFW5_9VIRU